MSIVAPYTHEERKESRGVVKRLEDLAVEAENMMHGRLPFNPKFLAGLHALTDASDLDNQVKALRTFAKDRRKAHLDHLAALAPQDLTAFAEVITPHEPPPKHLIWLSDRLMEIERGDRDRMMLSMPPGHAKDLCVETPVMMGDGTWKRLGDVETGDLIMSGKGRPREVLAVHDQGVRPTIRLTTRSGRSVVAHPEHQFLTPAGWIAAGELIEGSVLALPREFEVEAPISRRSRDEFILAGYFMARAVVTGRTYSRLHRITAKIRCDDPAILADIIAISKRMAFEHTTTREAAYGEQSILISFDEACRDWLEEVGLYNVKKDVARVPAWVFQGTEEDIGAFLGAVVSCDALFRPEVFKISLHLKVLQLAIKGNQGLADDLIKLFFRIGIRAASKGGKRSNYNYQAVDLFKVRVPDGEDQVLIQRRLRMIGQSKRFWDMPITVATWGSATYRDDPVVLIEAHPDTETRCLTVEEDHSFLAEGLVVHNSTYCSRLYPAWYLGKSENRIYLQAGHSAPFARSEFGRKTKDLVMSEAYRQCFPGLAVRFDAKASNDWILTNGNRYVTKGVGEGISGFRSTNNGVDDPYKDYRAAQSPQQRKIVWDWFVNDFMTRLLPLGNAFVIATRWHVADIIGTLEDMAARGEIDRPWDYINLPIFCDDPEGDPLRRNLGEEIWPEFYNKAVLLRQKQISTEANWQCLYEGKPLPAEGNIIKAEWLSDRYTTYPSILVGGDHKHAFPGKADPLFSSSPENEKPGAESLTYRRTVISVDSAEKDTQRADYTAITVWRETTHEHPYHYLVDAHLERMEFPRLVEAVGHMAAVWNADFVLMEEKGAGNQYIQHMAQQPDLPFIVVGINPGRDGKIFRMDAVTPTFQHKRVLLPRKAPWLGPFERELLQFPGGKHDDYPDSVSQYLKWARDNGMVRRGARRLGGTGHRRTRLAS